MRIETQRLALRAFRPEDGDDLYEILGDEETMKYSELPYSREKTQKFLEDFAFAEKGALAAEERSGGKVIGYLLFHPMEAGVYELGWFFNRAYWRQGFALEACLALKEYAFGKLNAKKLVAETIDTGRSVPLMEKLGMAREGVEQVRDPAGKRAELYVYGFTGEEEESV